MSKIEIKNLCFGFSQLQENLFENVSLHIDDQWKLGLVGRNGRGKTTFFNLLLNEFDYTGSIIHQKQFAYFPAEISDPNNLAFYCIDEIEQFEQWEIEKECQLLSLDPEVLWRPFSSLSGGEQTKLLLALVFLKTDAFPLIDEPTNHLDITSRRHIANYLKQKKEGFIVISHDRQFLNEVTDHTLAIEREQINLYHGNYEIYEEQKELQDRLEQKQDQKLKKEISRLSQTAKEKQDWGNLREENAHGRNISARLMKRSKAISQRQEKHAEEKKALLNNQESTTPIGMNPIFNHKNPILKVEDFSLGFTEGNYLFEPISFELQQGERVCLTGANGIGKSTFFDYLLNPEKYFTTGTMALANNTILDLLTQNFQIHTGLLKDFAVEKKIDYTNLLTALKKLGIERQSFETPIEQLSMGQRKKVEVSRSMLTAAELYLWDEPLNYLDIFNQEQIMQSIETYNPTLLFIEHDQYFSEKIATKTVALKKVVQ